MSGIKKRTVFIGVGKDGLMRLSPWARVITGVGSMMELNGSYAFSISAGIGVDAVRDHNWSSPEINEVSNFDPSGPTWGDGTIGGDPVPVEGY